LIVGFHSLLDASTTKIDKFFVDLLDCGSITLCWIRQHKIFGENFFCRTKFCELVFDAKISQYTVRLYKIIAMARYCASGLE